MTRLGLLGYLSVSVITVLTGCETTSTVVPDPSEESVDANDDSVSTQDTNSGSVEDTATEPSETITLLCIPGSTQACYCPGDQYGVQICEEDGQSFGPCECPDPLEPESDPSTGGETDLGDVTLEPCDAPLAFEDTGVSVLPLTLRSLLVTGGTGSYSFTLRDNQSGAIINALTGSYLSGELEGSVDTVAVTDAGCAGEAELEIDVVAAMQVLPASALVAVGGQVSFEVSAGSSQFAFTLSASQSGGTITPEGLYQAGDTPGTDMVEVVDMETHERVSVALTVLPLGQPTLGARAGRVVMAQGQVVDLAVWGGSGHVTVEVDAPFLDVEGVTLTATMAGVGVAELTDVYTGATASVTLEVVAPVEAEFFVKGDYLGYLDVDTGGDVTGDGLPDAVIGWGESHLGGFQAGAVFVYAADSDGVASEPVQTLLGLGRQDRFGKQVHVRDMTQDGIPDLLVGAPLNDQSASNAGSVYLFEGQPDGLFSDSPTLVWSGETGSDQFGWSLTACDFNGDGLEDLAVGGYRAENRDLDPRFDDQGRISIFLGTLSGPGLVASQTLDGHVLNGDAGWEPRANLRLGWSLAAGDIDGDGYCDLVASAERPFSNALSGAVFVYRGQPAEGFSLGGVTSLPALALMSPGDSDGRLGSGRHGSSLEVADLDEDGYADIIVAERYADGYAVADDGSVDTPSKGGRVWLVPGDMLTASTAVSWTSTDEVILLHGGNSASDTEGYALEIADVTGDGLLDVMVGAEFGELEGGPNNRGTVTTFAGREQAFPEPFSPVWVRGGIDSGDRFGAAMVPLADQTGDGVSELVAVALRANGPGRDVGEFYWVPSDVDAPLLSLTHVVAPGSQEFGRSTSLGMGPDGFTPLLAVGVEAYDSYRNGSGSSSRGGVFVYAADELGRFGPEPQQILEEITGAANSDRYGAHVTLIDDFDGDGRTDLAVVSEFDHRPDSFDETDFCGPGCGGEVGVESCAGSAQNDTGSVHIHLGLSDGTFTPQPQFTYFGLGRDDRLQRAVSIGDLNGDGRSDLLLGTTNADSSFASVTNSGSVSLLLGRGLADEAAGRVQLICNADWQFEGVSANDSVGAAITPTGDLNADGCDDFAFSATRQELGQSDEGLVWVVYGWGGSGCPTAAEGLVFESNEANARAGVALAGGEDISGDGFLDLVVGSTTHELDDDDVGGVWLVPGAYMASLYSQRQALPNQSLPIDAHPLVPLDVTEYRLLEGEQLNEDFGASISLLPGFGLDGRAAVWIGSPGKSLGGTSDAGQAGLYLYGDSGWETYPRVVMVGETLFSRSELGASVDSMRVDDVFYLSVGAPFGHAMSRDVGSVYGFVVEREMP